MPEISAKIQNLAKIHVFPNISGIQRDFPGFVLIFSIWRWRAKFFFRMLIFSFFFTKLAVLGTFKKSKINKFIFRKNWKSHFFLKNCRICLCPKLLNFLSKSLKFFSLQSSKKINVFSYPNVCVAPLDISTDYFMSKRKIIKKIWVFAKFWI